MRAIVKCLPIVLAVGWLWSSAAAAAAEELRLGPDLSASVGMRGLFTSGTTSWSSGVSELTWRGVDAGVAEINADVVWRRLVGRASFGGGGLSTGVLIDTDVSPASRTRSEVTGDGLFYGNIDVGTRLASWGNPRDVLGYLDLLFGYQYWREEYEAKGATGTVAVSPSLKVIRNEFSWTSLRLGGRAQIPVVGGWPRTSAGSSSPGRTARGEDTHFLRTSGPQALKQPSFNADADGGFGYQLEGGLSYRILGGLSAEAGFRYWKIDSGSGTDTAHLLTGDVRQRLKEIIIERYGPYVGVTYRF